MTEPVATADAVQARFRLKMPGGTLEADVAVPKAPMDLVQILPLAQALANRVVELSVGVAEAQGRRVSCKAGCGACCRQLVPLAPVEARAIHALVEAMPEPRRAAVKERFAEARRRLDESGWLDRLEARESWSREDRREVGVGYFRAGVPCPFLVDESCSIHPDRPLVCREYLVTSPPEHCAEMTFGRIDGIRLPNSVWTSMALFDGRAPGAVGVHWVPLVLALDWAEAHPDPGPPRPGPEVFRELIEHFTRSEVPPAPMGPVGAADAE